MNGLINNLMPETFKGRTWAVYDIEADDLLPGITKIHCIVIYTYNGIEIYDEVKGFGDDRWRGNIEQGVLRLQNFDILIGHNIIGYDRPAIKKVTGVTLKAFDVDSQVLSCFLFSDLKALDWAIHNSTPNGSDLINNSKGLLAGSHSLGAWGYRLGCPKDDYGKVHGFKEYTQGMLKYCVQDVMTNYKTFLNFMEKSAPENAVLLELEFATYLCEQMQNGCPFRKEYADNLVARLKAEYQEVETRLKSKIPNFVDKEVFIPKVNNSKLGYKKGEPFTKVTVTKFNPRSPNLIVRYLSEKYGWEPTEFTYKGNPKVGYEFLNQLPYPEAEDMATARLLLSRLATISDGNGAWFRYVRNGRIYGRIHHNGTPTTRCRHTSPNLGNIPTIYSEYGVECRECFGYEDDEEEWVLVGVDFDGLENRCLAEALWDYDNGAFYELALCGDKDLGTDCHSQARDRINAKIDDLRKTSKGLRKLEPRTRDEAKTCWYAWMYGAQAPHLGETIDSKKQVKSKRLRKKLGEVVGEAFIEVAPSIENLLDDLEAAIEDCKGWPSVVTIDGRNVPIRSMKARLNSLLQSYGAILMKVACVLIRRRCIAEGLWMTSIKPALHIHDEGQWEVRSEISEYASKLFCEEFARSGEYFGFRVPIVAQAKIGTNWAMTH